MALDTSKFLGGNGSLSSPFIIHDADALLALISDEHSDGSAQGRYFEVIADVDLTYINELTLKSTNITGSVIYGNGHLFNLPVLNAEGGFDNLLFGSNTAEIFNLHFNVLGKSGSLSYGPVRRCKLFNCKVTGNYGDIKYESFDIAAQFLQNCFFYLEGVETRRLSTSSSYSSISSYYVEGSAPITNTDLDGMISINDAYTAASYANLDSEHWEVTDGLLPTLKVKPYSGLPITRVAGVIKIDGVGAKRRINILDSNGGRVSNGYSDPSTGVFDIQTSPLKSALTIVINDDIGFEIKASTTYELGNIVHPADYAGIAYVCTTAGDTDATLPMSYPKEGDFTSGTATFSAKPIHKPQVFSPVKPEIVLE